MWHQALKLKRNCSTDQTARADPEFFSGGGALVSNSTSTPINHIVFFLQNTSGIRKPQVISGGGGVRTPCTLPLDPPLDCICFNIINQHLRFTQIMANFLLLLLTYCMSNVSSRILFALLLASWGKLGSSKRSGHKRRAITCKKLHTLSTLCSGDQSYYNKSLKIKGGLLVLKVVISNSIDIGYYHTNFHRKK